jgi:hypothetical protein
VIIHSREALALFRSSYPSRSLAFNYFTHAILYRFEQTGQSKDLGQATTIVRHLLCLRDILLAYVYNLTAVVGIHFDQANQREDLEKLCHLLDSATEDQNFSSISRGFVEGGFINGAKWLPWRYDGNLGYTRTESSG